MREIDLYQTETTGGCPRFSHRWLSPVFSGFLVLALTNKDDKIRLVRNSTVEFLIFTSQAGEQSIEVRYEDETIWLTQKMMATLFDVTVANINIHLKKSLKPANYPRSQLLKNI